MKLVADARCFFIFRFIFMCKANYIQPFSYILRNKCNSCDVISLTRSTSSPYTDLKYKWAACLAVAAGQARRPQPSGSLHRRCQETRSGPHSTDTPAPASARKDTRPVKTNHTRNHQTRHPIPEMTIPTTEARCPESVALVGVSVRVRLVEELSRFPRPPNR